MSELDLPLRVRQRIYDHAYAFPGAEVGGILLGAFPSAERRTTEVVGMLPAFDARGDLTSLTFTHEAWADLHAMKEVQFPSDAIVGWYHSHPGHGIFLSEHDLFVHRNFFPHEASVAFVMDPIRHEEGLFEIAEGAMQERFIRPVDAPEAIISRRSGARRGPGHRTKDASEASGSAGADRPKMRSARRPSNHEDSPAAAVRGPSAVDVVLTDLGVLAGALAIGVFVVRFVIG